MNMGCCISCSSVLTKFVVAFCFHQTAAVAVVATVVGVVIEMNRPDMPFPFFAHYFVDVMDC